MHFTKEQKVIWRQGCLLSLWERWFLRLIWGLELCPDKEVDGWVTLMFCKNDWRIFCVSWRMGTSTSLGNLMED